MTQGRGKRRLFAALCLGLTLLFGGLGVWQVQRLFWKLDLIERVDRRVHAAPASISNAAQWRSASPAELEYRRVRVTGTFLHDRQTLVDALTELGPGDWIVTPLVSSAGTILVNRGFVPKDRVDDATHPDGVITITGLIRISEPRGRFLRPNRPNEDRWFSRDVPAIANKRGLGAVAPFFIDAEASSGRGEYPVGGLTVVKFRNTHLIYALTWFGLAALTLFGLVLLLKPEHGRR